MRLSSIHSMILVGCAALSSAGCAASSDAEPSKTTNGALVDGVKSSVTGDGVIGLMLDIYDGKSHGSCSATLIADNVILTAAHCVVNKAGTVVNALAFDGTSYEARTWQSALLPTTSAVVYPGYDVKAQVDYAKADGWQNDLAILVLPVAAPAGIRRVPLPARESDDLYAIGSTVTLTGYGVTSAKANDGGRKRNGSAPILDSFARHVVLEKSDGATSACFGDSGGPIRARTADGPILGVASWVHADLQGGVELCQGESIYMRVSAYRDFIDAVVGAFAPPR